MTKKNAHPAGQTQSQNLLPQYNPDSPVNERAADAARQLPPGPRRKLLLFLLANGPSTAVEIAQATTVWHVRLAAGGLSDCLSRYSLHLGFDGEHYWIDELAEGRS